MTNRIGAYIHIPFCSHICHYCDFTKSLKNRYVNDYILSLCNQINECIYDFDSIYIGGGTPSCLSIEEIEPLFNILDKYTNVKEFTIEVNPENVCQEKIQFYKKHRVNRISIGVQTTNNDLLKYIGRKHNYDDVIDSVNIIRNNGINNISLDIMYGFSGQKLLDIQKDIKNVLQLKPNHLSLYSLTIEPNTVFGKRKEKKVSTQLETNAFIWISNYLISKGYYHYEIANFSIQGYESYHNLKYWNYQDFIGFGIGASSKLGNIRTTNTHNLKDYLQDNKLLSESIVLESKDLLFEKIMMGLRLEKGIQLSNDEYLFYKSIIDKHVFANNITFNNFVLKVNEEARLYLHDILVDFL